MAMAPIGPAGAEGATQARGMEPQQQRLAVDAADREPQQQQVESSAETREMEQPAEPGLGRRIDISA